MPMNLKDWKHDPVIKDAEAARRNKAVWDYWTPRVCFGGGLLCLAILLTLLAKEVWL
jgi:hypothetical protein